MHYNNKYCAINVKKTDQSNTCFVLGFFYVWLFTCQPRNKVGSFRKLLLGSYTINESWV